MNIIEAYLVKIGATIDREAFNGAAQAINQLAAMAEKLGRAFKYGALLAAIAKVTEAIVQNIKAVKEAYPDLDVVVGNIATAEALIHALERGDLDWRDIVNPK